MAAEFFNNLKLFLYIQKSNVKTAFLNKADALINVLMMLINNLAFFFMWWVIFQHKGTINGWGIGEMALLYMAINNAFASFALFARGIQALPEYIDNGTLDNYLATPRNPLFMISTSESTFANWGDFLTGLLAFFWSGYLSWTTFFIMLLVSFFAFVILYAYRLIMSSLAFFVSDSQRLGDNVFMAFVTFASQPASIFTGWYKVMFLTVIPAGFISLYPVELIKNFNLTDLGIMVGGCSFFFILSVKFFYFGLRRYTSGNRFGVR